MSLARKIFSNTAWQILGKVATAVLGIISIKLITNYLSPTAYGEYTTIYDFTALFAIGADFGLFTIAVREMAQNNRRGMIEKIVGNVLSLRGFLAIISLGLGVVSAFLIPVYHETSIPFGVLIISFATVITLLAGTMASVLQYHLRMQWTSIALAGGKLITVLYIVFTILYVFPHNPEAGFIHLLFAWIIGGMVTLLITYEASRKLVSISFQFDVDFWKKVFLKALPYGLALVLGTVYFRMGTIILSLFNMKKDIGYYGVPLRFLEILQIIPHYFMNSVLPVLTVSFLENRERSSRIIRYSLNVLAAVALPIFVGGYLLAWPIIAAVSSPEFLSKRTEIGIIWGSDMALKILLGAMIFTYFHVVLSYTLVAMERQKQILWANTAAVLANIVLNLVLVPHFGFLGAAMSAVVSEIIIFSILVMRVRKYISHIWDFPFLWKTALSAGFMGLSLFFFADTLHERWLSKSLFFSIPLGGIVFIISILATKALSRDMFQVLRKTEAPQEEIHTF